MNAKTKSELLNPFVQASSNVFGTNRLLKGLLAAITVGVFLIYGSVNSFLEHQQTIIQPIGGADPYEIGNYDANYDYLYDMAETIVNLSGNLSARSAKTKLNQLLDLFHDSVYSRYQKHFKTMGEEVSKFSTISHIAELARPEPIYVLDNRLRIRVKKSRVVGATVKPAEIKFLLVDYQIINGRFWIMDMVEMTQAEYHEAKANED